jgi:hypothetical protein
LADVSSSRSRSFAQLIRRMKKIFPASHLQHLDFVEVSRIRRAAPPEKNIQGTDQEASEAILKSSEILQVVDLVEYL